MCTKSKIRHWHTPIWRGCILGRRSSMHLPPPHQHSALFHCWATSNTHREAHRGSIKLVHMSTRSHYLSANWRGLKLQRWKLTIPRQPRLWRPRIMHPRYNHSSGWTLELIRAARRTRRENRESNANQLRASENLAHACVETTLYIVSVLLQIIIQIQCGWLEDWALD